MTGMAQATRQRASRSLRMSAVRTAVVRVPADDWPSVKQGRKTEFRSPLNWAVSNLWTPEGPLPVLGYMERETVRTRETAMFVMEETWIEPLGAMSAESLMREGFPSFAHFRRYWMARTGTRFRPLDRVHVLRVHPMTPDEQPEMGLQLLRKLYGEHL